MVMMEVFDYFNSILSFFIIRGIIKFFVNYRDEEEDRFNYFFGGVIFRLEKDKIIRTNSLWFLLRKKRLDSSKSSKFISLIKFSKFRKFMFKGVFIYSLL